MHQAWSLSIEAPSIAAVEAGLDSLAFQLRPVPHIPVEMDFAFLGWTQFAYIVACLVSMFRRCRLLSSDVDVH